MLLSVILNILGPNCGYQIALYHGSELVEIANDWSNLKPLLQEDGSVPTPVIFIEADESTY